MSSSANSWLQANMSLVLATLAGVGVAWVFVALQARPTAETDGRAPARTVIRVSFRDRVVRFLSWSTRMRLARKLVCAGLYRMQISDLVLLYFGLSVGSAVITLWLSHSLWLSLGAAILGLIVVENWVRGKERQFCSRIARHLPGFLDLLCLCLFAGMSFNNALMVVLRYMSDGPLRILWRDWLFDVRAGSTRVEALSKLLSKSAQPSLQRLCVAMIQAEKTGAALAPGLQSQAKQLRTEQLLSAERRAAQAPMKMLMPLIICFFPSTFLVLAFSIWVGVNDML